MTGEPDKAIADFTEAIRLDPRDAEAHFKRALAYEKKGEKGKAESDFTKAKELGYDWEDGEPLFMVLRAEDPELTASPKKAQETLPSFLEALRNGRHRQKAYLVKALFSGTDRDGGSLFSLRSGTYGHDIALTCAAGVFSLRIALADPRLGASDYFLVVAGDGAGEGSYGRDSRGVERPVSAAACAPAQDLTPCVP